MTNQVPIEEYFLSCSHSVRVVTLRRESNYLTLSFSLCFAIAVEISISINTSIVFYRPDTV